MAQSEVNLLVDFISVKLAKLERGSAWSGLGSDISNFKVPERGQMKSNFLKTVLPKVEPVKEEPVVEEPKVEEVVP